MAKRGNARRMALNAEINVVSLIDVILLLLLIFMITAPMMTQGIDISLPTGQVTNVESKNAILVEIDRAGKIYVDGKVWQLTTLKTGFKAYAQSRGEVTVRADRNILQGLWYDVISALNAQGIKDFNLAGTPAEGTG